MAIGVLSEWPWGTASAMGEVGALGTAAGLGGSWGGGTRLLTQSDRRKRLHRPLGVLKTSAVGLRVGGWAPGGWRRCWPAREAPELLLSLLPQQSERALSPGCPTNTHY